MLDEVIMPASADQFGNADGEYINALNDALEAGLIDPAEGQRLNAEIAVGMRAPDSLQTEVASLLASGPAAERGLDAIAGLFEPQDVIELRAIDPAGGGSSCCGRLGVASERAALVAFIREHIGLSNIFFGANPRRGDMAGTKQAGNAVDVVARRAMFLDFDQKDAPSNDPDWSLTLAELRALGPVLITRSGNGYHVWLRMEALEGTDVEAATGPLVEAMRRLGADNMADPARIGRVPFSVNLPNKSKRKRGAVACLALPDALTLPAAEPRPLGALCGAVEGIASRIGLPGRGQATTGRGSNVAPHFGANGERKTGWPAPSADLLRMALREIPNERGGAFEDRSEWAEFGLAVKGAAMAGGIQAEGRDAWLEWCARWGGGDPDHDARFWDDCRDPHVGWGRVMQTLERVNPAGAEAVRAEAARLAFAEDAQQTAQSLSVSPICPVEPFVPGQIPPRPWIYGRSAIRGFLSLLVAPGAAGKSALMMVEAVAMATGRELLAGEEPHRPLRVWYHNSEDGLDEQHRRLAAVMMHHGVQHADLGGRLVLTSGRTHPIRLARMGRDGPEIVPGVVDWIVDMARKLGADVLCLDPLGAMHGLPENSNEAINLLAGALREIADRAQIAVVILHHASKAAATDMDAAGAGASRGASALVDAVRVSRQIVRMTPQEAVRLGVAESERRDFLRVENGKMNLARAEDARWFRLVPVQLGNVTQDYPSGDEVVAVERWEPPAQQPGTASDLALVQAAIDACATLPRLDHRSPDWVGWVIADALGLDAGSPSTPAKERTPEQTAAHARARGLLHGWLRDGGLVEREGKDDRRRTVRCVGIGRPAVLDPAEDDTTAGRHGNAKVPEGQQ